jgi:hypothetical protein
MKELVKRILESGLVEKHAALLLEKWGQLEPGASDLVGRVKVTQEGLSKFAEEIESLVSLDASTIKETRLEVQVLRPPFKAFSPSVGEFLAYEDKMGNLIVDHEIGSHISAGLHLHTCSGSKIVLGVFPLYEGEKIVAYQVSVESGTE